MRIQWVSVPEVKLKSGALEIAYQQSKGDENGPCIQLTEPVRWGCCGLRLMITGRAGERKVIGWLCVC